MYSVHRASRYDSGHGARPRTVPRKVHQHFDATEHSDSEGYDDVDNCAVKAASHSSQTSYGIVADNAFISNDTTSNEQFIQGQVKLRHCAGHDIETDDCGVTSYTKHTPTPFSGEANLRISEPKVRIDVETTACESALKLGYSRAHVSAARERLQSKCKLCTHSIALLVIISELFLCTTHHIFCLNIYSTDSTNLLVFLLRVGTIGIQYNQA